jgi:tRNA-specific 2-thiouridylase
VVAIDAAKNAIIAGPARELPRRKFIVSSLRLIALKTIEGPIRVRAKIRYKHREASALVTPLSPRRVSVEFERPQRAITPGQSVVFYRRDIVLGGGIIDHFPE